VPIDGLRGLRSARRTVASRNAANPPYEAVNLSRFTVPDMSQINDLDRPKTPKIEKIHILYEPFSFDEASD